jgi:secreted trypsin-like serine protease
MKYFNRKFLFSLGTLLLLSSTSLGLMNGQKAENLFPFVGSLGGYCTFTKIAKNWYITAGHCVGSESFLLSPAQVVQVTFGNLDTEIHIDAVYTHESWTHDCGRNGLTGGCTGKEVGSTRMTPGRSDVALIHSVNEVEEIPAVDVHFEEVLPSTTVYLVGQGCTQGIPADATIPGEMRFAKTITLPGTALEHEHSLYKNISKITALSNIITPGIISDSQASSLCPGDSGGPLLVLIEGVYKVAGIAADYTFDGPYVDGAPTVTNVHTRLDNNNYNKIGLWIRQTMKNHSNP